jgi:hypothetical protein
MKLASFFPESWGHADVGAASASSCQWSLASGAVWADMWGSAGGSLSRLRCHHSSGSMWESVVTVQCTLTFSCAELLLGVVGSLTGLLWYPSQQAGSPSFLPVSYPEKCYRSQRHELVIPNPKWSERVFPSLKMVGKCLGCISLEFSVHGFSNPACKFTT